MRSSTTIMALLLLLRSVSLSIFIAFVDFVMARQSTARRTARQNSRSSVATANTSAVRAERLAELTAAQTRQSHLAILSFVACRPRRSLLSIACRSLLAFQEFRHDLGLCDILCSGCNASHWNQKRSATPY
jgi:hypothetical protein